jgi:hypothetical protein
MNVPTDLERAIVRTLIWFSLTDHPVSAHEIYKWMLEPEHKYEMGQVVRALDVSEYLNQKIQRDQGMYALKGQLPISKMVRGRRRRFIDAERKFKTLRRWSLFFRLLPGVRAVAAGNTLAWWGTNSESDIDLFIVTEPGTIWSGRFWSVLPFALLGRRPHTGKSDPFCLSFFATTDALQMEGLCLERDRYMAYWIKSLVPVMDKDGCLDKLQQENRWVETFLPNASVRQMHHRHVPINLPSPILQPKVLEPIFRSIQRRRLPLELRDMANTDTRVVVTDDVLKFHVNDRREHFRDQFEALAQRHL